MWPLGSSCWRALIAEFCLFSTQTPGTIHSDKSQHPRMDAFRQAIFLCFSSVCSIQPCCGLEFGFIFEHHRFFSWPLQFWSLNHQRCALGSPMGSAWAWPSQKQMPKFLFLQSCRISLSTSLYLFLSLWFLVFCCFWCWRWLLWAKWVFLFGAATPFS